MLHTGNSTYLLFSLVIHDKHWEEDIGLLGLALQRESSNCLVLIPHRQLGNYLLSTGDSYNLTAHHIHMTLYKSMFDNYQQVEYLLRPRTVHSTESMCKCVVVTCVEWTPGKHQIPKLLTLQHLREHLDTYVLQQCLKPSLPKKKLF